MMFYSDDPSVDFERHDREQEKKRMEMPSCCDCGRTMWENYFCVDGEILCEDCVGHRYRVEVCF